MAKLRGALRLQGLDRSSGLIYVKRGGEYYTRKQQEPGTHKGDKVLMGNANAAASINGLASTLNKVFKYYSEGFLSKCYTRLLSALFTADHAARIVRLSMLKGFDGHTRKTLGSILSDYKTTINNEKKSFRVRLELNRHALLPDELKFYYVQLILVCWNKKEECSHREKHTKWIELKDAMPLAYEMNFEKPAGATDWLLLCCCVRGEERKEERLPPERTIKVIDTGSFDKHALAILEKHRSTKKTVEKKEPKSFMRDDEGVGPV